MYSVRRLFPLPGLFLRRVLLVLVGTLVVQAAQADLINSGYIQTPSNNVAPGNIVEYGLQVSSNAIGASDAPVISIMLNGNDITDQFSNVSSNCSLDGAFYCTSVDSAKSRTFQFRWDNTPQQTGTYKLTFEVNCDYGSSANCVGYSLPVTTVIAAPPPPVANNDSATTQADTAVSIDVLANDSDPSGFSISVDSITPPAHGSAVDNNGSSITYTPTAGYSGTDRFSYTIRNTNGDTASAVVDVTVTPPPTPPVAKNDTAATQADTAVTINVLANDSDPNNLSLSVDSTTSPAHGTLTQSGNLVTYTPSAGYTGADRFGYTISNTNGATDSALVDLTVVANTVPVAVADSAITTPGTAVTINLMINDQIPQGQQISVKSVTAPVHGTAVNNNDGTATYTPNIGFTGTDAFSYDLADADGQVVSTASVNVVVSAVTTTTAINDTAKTKSGTAVLINLLANDQIPQDQPVTVLSITTPENGSVVNNNDGTATYTPNSDFTGTDTFSYTLADSDGQPVATATVSVTVASTDVGPSATTNLQSLPNLTDNQRSVAVVIDQLCASTTDTTVANVCNIIAGLSTTDQVTALQQITPDQLAAQGSTAVETSTTQLTNIKMRLMALRQGATGLSMNGFSMDIKGNGIPMGALLAAMQNKGGGGAGGDILGNGRLGVFVNGRINFGSLDTTSRQTGFDFNTNGITVGVDYRFTDRFVAGGALGYASTSSNYSGSGGKMDSSDLSVSTYGSFYLPRNAYIDWIATYGSTDYDTTRNMTFSGLSTQASGSTGGDQFALSVNAGMDFNRRDLLLTPYARLEYTSNSIDAYQESGGSGLALGYNSQTIESLTTALAGRISKAMSMNWGILTPSAHVEWEHQYKDNNRLITAHFVADPSVSFSVATDSPDRNYFNVGFGMAATLPGGRSAFIDYEAVIGQDHVTNSTIDLGVRMAF